MSHSARTVLIHPSFRAAALRSRRIASLQQAAVDPAFHYAGVRQAELWLRVHQVHAPGSIDPDFERVYRRLARDLARALTGQSVHVIGLGSGGGEKEAWVLEALQQQGCDLRYTPVDISPELALLSAEVAEARFEGCIQPVVGDLSLLATPDDWLHDAPATVRVYTAFGLTPNFTPSWLLGHLGRILRDDDHLLLSANLAPVSAEDEADYHEACLRVLPQYDNPETRTWLRQVLIDWGIAEHLSEPVFELASLEGIAGFFAWSQWLTDVRFDWEGQPFTARKGDRLRLFFSLRYTPKRLTGVLVSLGLQPVQGDQTRNGEEGVWRIVTEASGESGTVS